MGNVPLLSFNGGEIGKKALARIDLPIYSTCAETMLNVLPAMEGPMSRVPGTEYIGTLADNTAAILRPFIYNIDQVRVLQLRDSEIRIVSGNAYQAITGAAATIGTPVDNTSTGGSSVSVSGQNVTFTATAGGEARAYWPITAGVNGSPTTFQFTVERRPIKIRVGTTTAAEDILAEITLDPGIHVITFTPSATTYYFRARLVDEGKAVLTGITRLAAGTLAIPTPYLAADLSGLRFEQSNDVVWIFHTSYRTRVLERRGDTSWSLRYYAPPNGPFETVNQTTTTMTPSALSGSINVTASAAKFASTSVGQLIQIEHQGQREALDATAVDQASEAIRVTGIDENRVFNLTVAGTFVGTVKLQKSVNEVDWLDVTTYSAAAAASVDDELPNQVVYYRFLCSAYTSGTIECELIYSSGTTTGRAEIVTYTSPTVVVAEVLESFGDTVASSLWSEGTWSDLLGWPAAGQLHENRHTTGREDRFFMSESDDYESHAIGVDASDAISRRLGTGDVNTIRWMESGDQLIIGTSGAEVRVFSNSLEEPIVPLNINARDFDDNGSADTQAVKAGSRVVFVDRTRSRLYQVYLDESTGRISTDNLCRLHVDIAGVIVEGSGDGFVEIAYQKRPEPRLWGVRSDGTLAVMLFGPNEGVYAWARVTAPVSGLFKSVCVVPGAPEDRVHVLVERVINSVTVTHHERFALENFAVETDADGVETAPAAWRLHCALDTDGAATTAFSGLDHLEGETVMVWGDGRNAGEYTVTAGAITTSVAIAYAIIGLELEGRWKSTKMAFGARGTALTMDKNVGRLGVVVYRTPVGVVSFGRSFDAELDQAVTADFNDGETMDAAVTLWSQEDNYPFEGATEIDSRVCLIFSGPGPATILALVPGVEVAER